MIQKSLIDILLEINLPENYVLSFIQYKYNVYFAHCHNHFHSREHFISFLLFLSLVEDFIDCFHYKHQFEFQIPGTQSNNSINSGDSCNSYDYDYFTTIVSPIPGKTAYLQSLKILSSKK